MKRLGVVTAILLLGFATSLIVNWPGHIGYDALIQLQEGRSGQYANWHPAIMSWMLGVADYAVPGAALFVAFDTIVLFAGMASLLWIAPRPSWAAAGVAALCVLTPQFMLYPAIVWKDVLFAVLAVAAFVCLAHAAVRWANARARFSLIGLALALAALSSLVRQNGALVMLGMGIAVGWIAARNGQTRLRGWLYGAGAVGASAVLFAGVLAALTTRMVGESGTLDQIKTLQIYDVTGAVAAQPGLELDVIRAADPALERAIRGDGVKLYTPQLNDPLIDAPAFSDALDDASPGMISRQWFALILHHPWLYLKVRARVFRWVVLPPDLSVCTPYELGVTTDLPQISKALGLKPRWDRRDDALAAYADRFVGTPVLSHVTYIVLALAALIFLLRRRRTADIAIAMMLVSALGFVASFFAISIACDYRYLVFVDDAALLAAFYISLTLRDPAKRPPSRLSSGSEAKNVR